MARHSRRRSSRHTKATLLATQLRMHNCGAALDTVMSMPSGTSAKKSAVAAFKLACVVGKKSKSKSKSMRLAGNTPFDGLGALGAAKKKRKKAKRKVARRRKARPGRHFYEYVTFDTPSREEHAAYRFGPRRRVYSYYPRAPIHELKTDHPLRKAFRKYIQDQL